MRKLVIGDIHGGLKALRQVLERARATPADRLIFLGDYVDGWSEAVETIEFLLDLKKTHSCVFLRGNHDALCNDWLKNGADNPTWLEHGGRATLESYRHTDEAVIQRHIAFNDSLVNYYVDKDSRLYIHAGFTNLKGVEQEYFSATFYWDRTLWELALSLNPALAREDATFPMRLLNYQEIFIGHTPVTRIGHTRPLRAANVWNVDTGAAFRGPLSILDADSKEVWQSDPVHLLYPGEAGRN